MWLKAGANMAARKNETRVVTISNVSERVSCAFVSTGRTNRHIWSGCRICYSYEVDSMHEVIKCSRLADIEVFVWAIDTTYTFITFIRILLSICGMLNLLLLLLMLLLVRWVVIRSGVLKIRGDIKRINDIGSINMYTKWQSGMVNNNIISDRIDK